MVKRSGETVADAPPTVAEDAAVMAAARKVKALEAEKRRVLDALATPDESAAQLAARLLENPSAGPDARAIDRPALQLRLQALDRALTDAGQAVESAKIAASRLILAEGGEAHAQARERIALAAEELTAALQSEVDMIGEWTRRGVRGAVRPVPLFDVPNLRPGLAALAGSVQPKGQRQ